MSVDDFDFGDENDELDLEDEVELEEEEAGTGTGRRPNRRTILLALVGLVLLCLICAFLGQTFGDSLMSFIPGQGAAPAAVPPAEDTAAPTDVDEALPEEAGEEPAIEEESLPEEATSEEEAAPEEEAAEGEAAEEEAASEEEATEEESAEEEAAEETTTTPVPGPTSTPTTAVIIADCDDNSPPVADANGPYEAMMGKSLAFVTFDGSGSEDLAGIIESYEWNFGDGSDPGMGESISHGYAGIGSYVATLTVTDNCGARSQDTADVTIVGPTPPSDNDDPPPPPDTPPPPPPDSATIGFCYRVQYGDTLSELAQYYGVPLEDLAAVNSVSREYFVIAGQGLFIPTGEIKGEPNIYQVQAGDTLNNIAYQCGLTIKTLAETNGLTVDANLTPGQNLIIPPWRQVNP